MAATQIKDGYNGGSDNQLKVNADGSINVNGGGGGSSDVNIHDSSGNPLTSAAGALNVNVVSTGASGTPISNYNEVSGVAIGVSQTVISYTVPPGMTFSLTRILLSGDQVGTIEVDFNSVTNAKQRLYYTSYNMTFDYNNSQGGFSLAAGAVITVKATNNSVDSVAAYNATLQGILA